MKHHRVPPTLRRHVAIQRMWRAQEMIRRATNANTRRSRATPQTGRPVQAPMSAIQEQTKRRRIRDLFKRRAK